MKVKLIAQACVPVVAVGTLAFGILSNDAQNRNAAKVACRATKAGAYGLADGLEDYLAGGPRATDPETVKFLRFLKANADKVYAGCVAQIH